MAHNRPPIRGFTLIEVLIVLAIIGTLAAVVIPSISPGLDEQLRSAARIAASELSAARELAITYNSQYEVRFDISADHLVLEHSGSDTTLDALPPSPFRSPQDPADQQITRLGELVGVSEPITIYSAYLDGDPRQAIDRVEFGPLGETTNNLPTVCWLSFGAGDGQRFISIEIHPVTGIASIGPIQSEQPTRLVWQGGNP